MEIEKFKLGEIYTQGNIIESFKDAEIYGEDLIGGRFILCKISETKRYAFISAGRLFIGGLSYKLISIYPPKSKPQT